MSNKLGKAQLGWVMYDWANSAYSLVIVSAIFPQVFLHFAGDHPVFLGINFGSAESLYTLSICVSYVVITLLSPSLSGIADFKGKSKLFMQIFTGIGSLSCMLLYFFNEGSLWIGVLGAIMGSIGYSGSLVFYNSFLPQIASKNEQDALSAKGYSYGYVGSTLLLVLLLAVMSYHRDFGFKSEMEVFQTGFVLVGLWWVLWSLWTFNTLPVSLISNESKEVTASILLKKGREQLVGVWNEFKADRRLKRFVRAFFATGLGLQTLIIVAPLFAIRTVGMGSEELIAVVLLMQILGIAGAFLFARLSKNKGTVVSIISCTIIYLMVCLMAVSCESKNVFFVLAGFMGFCLGGMQSQTRSAYAKMLPKTTSYASYFSFYDVVEKLSIVTGTLIYGTVAFFLDDSSFISAPKAGMFILSAFFMIALFLWVPLRKRIITT